MKSRAAGERGPHQGNTLDWSVGSTTTCGVPGVRAWFQVVARSGAGATTSVIAPLATS